MSSRLASLRDFGSPEAKLFSSHFTAHHRQGMINALQSDAALTEIRQSLADGTAKITWQRPQPPFARVVGVQATIESVGEIKPDQAPPFALRLLLTGSDGDERLAEAIERGEPEAIRQATERI